MCNLSQVICIYHSRVSRIRDQFRFADRSESRVSISSRIKRFSSFTCLEAKRHRVLMAFRRLGRAHSTAKLGNIIFIIVVSLSLMLNTLAVSFAKRLVWSSCTCIGLPIGCIGLCFATCQPSRLPLSHPVALIRRSCVLLSLCFHPSLELQAQRL